MKRKYITIGIVIVLLALIVFKLSANKKVLDASTKNVQNAIVSIPVKIAAVQEQQMQISIKKTGTLAPFKEAKILAPVSGILQYLKVDLGDQIEVGQVVAIMDTRLQKLDVEKAETNVAKLKNDYETYSELMAGKAATQEKVNETKQDYENAVNQYNQSKKSLNDDDIKSPTSGIISAKSVEQGVYVNAGTEIATVVNSSKIKVQVNLDESEIYQIKLAQVVAVTADVYPGKVFKGAITFISPQADEAHNYMVEVTITNDAEMPLHSGTFVYADFSRTVNRQILLIPRAALVESIQNAQVYLVSGNKAHLTNIKTGIEVGDQIEVTSGLNKNDIVVQSGQINLKDGTQVSTSN
jgi:membrane fusion protein (multidrug efflux system)